MIKIMLRFQTSDYIPPKRCYIDNNDNNKKVVMRMDNEGANNNFRLAYYDGKIVLLLLSFPFVEIKQSLRPLELIY